MVPHTQTPARRRTRARTRTRRARLALPRTAFWPHALVYLCAQVMDALSTLVVLAYGGREINPVLDAARLTRGVAGLLALKALFVVLVWCAARVAYLAPSTRGTRLAAVIFWLGALAGLLLAAANVSVLTLYLAAPR